MLKGRSLHMFNRSRFPEHHKPGGNGCLLISSYCLSAHRSNGRTADQQLQRSDRYTARSGPVTNAVLPRLACDAQSKVFSYSVFHFSADYWKLKARLYLFEWGRGKDRALRLFPQSSFHTGLLYILPAGRNFHGFCNRHSYVAGWFPSWLATHHLAN